LQFLHSQLGFQIRRLSPPGCIFGFPFVAPPRSLSSTLSFEGSSPPPPNRQLIPEFPLFPSLPSPSHAWVLFPTHQRSRFLCLEPCCHRHRMAFFCPPPLVFVSVTPPLLFVSCFFNHSSNQVWFLLVLCFNPPFPKNLSPPLNHFGAVLNLFPISYGPHPLSLIFSTLQTPPFFYVVVGYGVTNQLLFLSWSGQQNVLFSWFFC